MRSTYQHQATVKSDGQINVGIGVILQNLYYHLLAVYIIAGNKDYYFEDSSVWAKSIFVGLVARGFPVKDDVVNEIIIPAL